MSDTLRRDLGIADPDGFYASLIDSHRGLTTEQSLRLNARLILLLANHIGAPEVLAAALHEARRAATDDPARSLNDSSHGSAADG